MGHRSETTLRSFGKITQQSVEKSTGVPEELKGSLSERIDMQISDPLVTRYSFDDASDVEKNDHRSDAYNAVISGTTSVPGIAGDAATKLLVQGSLADQSSYSRAITNSGVTMSGSDLDIESADYLDVGVGPEWAFSGDYTIEVKASTPTTGVTQKLLSTRTASAGFEVGFANNGKLFVTQYGNYYTLYSSILPVVADTEYHLVMMKKSGILYIIVDGNIEGSVAAPGALINSGSMPLRIGGSPSFPEPFAGKVDFVRVTGKALYSTENPASTGVLVRSDKTNGSTDFSDVDAGPCDLTATAVGNVQHSTADPQVNATSLSFDGTGDGLDFPDSDDWDFGTGDFTIRCKAYFATGGYTHQMLVSHGGLGGVTANSIGWSFMLYNGSSRRISFVNGHSGFSPFSIYAGIGSPTPNNDQWYDLAVCRKSGVLSFYIDGTKYASEYNNGSSTLGQEAAIGEYVGPLRVGIHHDQISSSANALKGMVEEVEVIKGRALYDASFTPSTSPIVPLNEEAEEIPVTLSVVESQYGKALKFTTTSGVMKFDVPTLTTTSFCAWVKIINPVGNKHFVNFVSSGASWYSNTKNGAPNDMWHFWGTGHKVFSYVSNEWFHYTMTIGSDKRTVKTYLNGELTDVEILPYDISITAFSVNGYYLNAGATGEDAEWDDVRVYNREITPEEIMDLVKPGARALLETREPDALYDFGDPVEGKLNDSSGNDNHGVLTGTPSKVIDGPGNGTSTSWEFNGTTDKVTISDLPQSAYFTAGCWAKADGTQASYSDIFARSRGSNPYGGWLLNFTPTGTMYFQANISGTWTNVVATSVALPLNEWVHVALTYDGVRAKIYFNGVVVANQAIAGVIAYPEPIDLIIGGSGDQPSLFFKGMVSNFFMASKAYTQGEIEKIYYDEIPQISQLTGQVAHYDMSLLDPEAPYTSDANTKLLLSMESEATLTADESDSDHSIVNTGSVVVSDNYSKFGNLSAYFDGSNSLIVAPNSDWDFGTADFTIDTFARTDTTVGGNIWSFYIDGNNYCYFSYNKDMIKWYCSAKLNGASVTLLSDSYPISVTEWYHVALVRNAGTFTFYVNGIAVKTDSSNSSAFNFASSSLFIGRRWDGYGMKGNLAEFRVSNVARWSSNFTTPDKILLEDKEGSNDGAITGAIQTISRKGFNGLDMGNALSFNGTSDKVVLQALGDLSTTASISLWVKPTTDGVTRYLMDCTESAGVGSIQINASNNVVASSGTIYVNGNSSIAIAKNTWSLVTVVGMTLNSTASTVIGCLNSGASYFSGLLDDLRVYDNELTLEEITALYVNKTQSELPGYVSAPEPSSYYLTYGQQDTPNIDFNASNSVIQTALEANVNIGAGNVGVTTQSEDIKRITFQSELALKNLPFELQGNMSTPLGGEASLNREQEGGPQEYWDIVNPNTEPGIVKVFKDNEEITKDVTISKSSNLIKVTKETSGDLTATNPLRIEHWRNT